MLRDQLGNNIWRLAEAHLIRRPIPSPNSPSGGCYYNLLLDHAPFRDEAEVNPPDGNYFNACLRRGVFTTDAQLGDLIAAYTRYSIWSSAKLEELQGQVMAGLADANMPLGASRADAGDAAADDPAVTLAGAAAMEGQPEDGQLPAGQAQQAAAMDQVASSGMRPDTNIARLWCRVHRGCPHVGPPIGRMYDRLRKSDAIDMARSVDLW